MSEEVPTKRSKNTMGDAGIMVWSMVLPNGLVYVFKIDGKVDSVKYVILIQDQAVPVLKSHFGEKTILFQQDNAPIHNSKFTLPSCSILDS
jgi:hypothetical protein